MAAPDDGTQAAIDLTYALGQVIEDQPQPVILTALLTVLANMAFQNRSEVEEEAFFEFSMQRLRAMTAEIRQMHRRES